MMLGVTQELAQGDLVVARAHRRVRIERELEAAHAEPGLGLAHAHRCPREAADRVARRETERWVSHGSQSSVRPPCTRPAATMAG